MNKVVHFEIPAEDLARATAFYGSLFDWELQQMEMDDGTSYTIVRTTAVDEKQMPTEPGAINGGMVQRTAETPSPVLTVDVESVDDTLKQVEAGGGSVVRPRSEIPGMGAFAYFKDPEGNVVGLWENLS
jgi:uncharacterized protein